MNRKSFIKNCLTVSLLPLLPVKEIFAAKFVDKSNWRKVTIHRFYLKNPPPLYYINNRMIEKGDYWIEHDFTDLQPGQMFRFSDEDNIYFCRSEVKYRDDGIPYVEMESFREDEELAVKVIL